MARFYAKFDNNKDNSLENSFFDVCGYSGGSGSGALLRDGLIASRSAVSNDVYDDLDSVNKDGGRGIIFPLDASTTPSSTLISWSNAYSASAADPSFIKIPTSNVYGSDTFTINYSKRPTGSISFSQSALIGAVDPADPIQLNFDVLKSASYAVRTVLESIKTGSSYNITQTPFSRPGTSASRTLHSVWSDPTMSYFAWDDFTPGAPVYSSTIVTQNSGPSPGSPCTKPGGVGPYQFTAGLRFYWDGRPQFKNDLNSTTPNIHGDGGRIRIICSFVYPGIGAGEESFASTIDETIFVTGSGPTGNGYYWDRNVTFYADDDDDFVNLTAKVTMSYFDPIITTNTGSRTMSDSLTINFGCPNGL
jgi:hypothetical protein